MFYVCFTQVWVLYRARQEAARHKWPGWAALGAIVQHALVPAAAAEARIGCAAVKEPITKTWLLCGGWHTRGVLLLKILYTDHICRYTGHFSDGF